MQARARCPAHRHLFHPQGALVGDEDVVDDDGLAARTLQSHREPVVDDLVLRTRDQEPAALHRAVVVRRLHGRREPGAVVRAAGEEALAGPAVAALDPDRLADGIDAGRYARLAAKDLSLDVLRELSDHPEVGSPERVDPAGRRAGLAE